MPAFALGSDGVASCAKHFCEAAAFGDVRRLLLRRLRHRLRIRRAGGQDEHRGEQG
jgi:hypothetical protein